VAETVEVIISALLYLISAVCSVLGTVYYLMSAVCCLLPTH
jgi:hypothetical protein